VDQLAAGQVETLYGLHSAAAGVRQQAEQLRTAAAVPAETLASAAADVRSAQATLADGRTALQLLTDTLRTELAEQVAAQVTAQVHEQVRALVDAQVDDVVARVTAATDALAASAATWERQANEAAGASAAAIEHQTHAVTQQLNGAGERVEAAARRTLELLEQATTSTRTELERATQAAVERLASSAEGAEERLASGTESLVRAASDTAAAIDEAGRILVDEFAARVASFFSQLQQDLTRRESRDASREKALYARVEQLAAHGELRVEELTERLSQATAQLLRRDQELEGARAEAFVDVLETLLTKLGGRRQLRARVREVVQVDRQPPPSTTVSPTPVEHAAERTQTAPAKQAPAKRAPAKKAPVKKAPAKKAAPRKKEAR
jgi:heparin binding hemagglutinin HbhA